ncbi:diguanylate cyclase domain-containing protein [Herbaspirillum sp. NPDC087042]|uniref:diguanylate cyclase domain-containing protein n=1 Tax=Herbaspirillum sp. NPDC087042 TaxID=3364004 RepID=UPI00381101E5
MFGMDNHEMATMGSLLLGIAAPGLLLTLLARARSRCRQLDRQLEQVRASTEALRRQALHDSLTGLPNRVLLEDRIEQAIAKAHRDHGRFALLFIDLDDFKRVNDEHGHAAGDLLLVQLGRRLLGSLRQSDTVARIGGDEFVVLTEIAANNDVSALREKITHALAQPFQIGAARLQVSASLGHARFPEEGLSMAELLARADEGMYHLKRQRRPDLLRGAAPPHPETATARPLTSMAETTR